MHCQNCQNIVKKTFSILYIHVWCGRTKLKQTEVNCEILKKCCESLTEENKMLKKELEDLKSMKTALQGPLFMQLPVPTLTICPSCQRISGGSAATTNTASSPTTTTTTLLVGPKPHHDHHFYKNNYTFTQSSAACQPNHSTQLNINKFHFFLLLYIIQNYDESVFISLSFLYNFSNFSFLFSALFTSPLPMIYTVYIILLQLFLWEFILIL